MKGTVLILIGVLISSCYFVAADNIGNQNYPTAYNSGGPSGAYDYLIFTFENATGTYYAAKDSFGRVVDAWTSTNAVTTFSSVAANNDVQINVAAGTYPDVSNVMGGSNQVWVGAGNATIISLPVGSTSPIFNFSEAKNSKIRDICFEGKLAEQPYIYIMGAVTIQYCEDVTVENCYFVNHRNAGIRVEYSTNINIGPNNVFQNIGPGSDLPSLNTSYGVWIRNSMWSSVFNNKFSDFGDMGIGNGYNYHISITGNVFNNVTDNNVDINECHDYLVADNTFDKNYQTRSAIFMGHNSTNGLIDSNIIKNGNFPGEAGGIIQVFNHDNQSMTDHSIRISNNKAENCIGIFIMLYQANNCSVVGNEGKNVTEHGISIYENGGFTDVKANKFLEVGKATDEHGISVYETGNVTIRDNTIVGGKGSGIRVFGTAKDDVYIGGNTLTDNAGYGISISSGMHAVVLEPNYFTRNGAGAIQDLSTSTYYRYMARNMLTGGFHSSSASGWGTGTGIYAFDNATDGSFSTATGTGYTTEVAASTSAGNYTEDMYANQIVTVTGQAWVGSSDAAATLNVYISTTSTPVADDLVGSYTPTAANSTVTFNCFGYGRYIRLEWVSSDAMSSTVLGRVIEMQAINNRDGFTQIP